MKQLLNLTNLLFLSSAGGEELDDDIFWRTDLVSANRNYRERGVCEDWGIGGWEIAIDEEEEHEFGGGMKYKCGEEEHFIYKSDKGLNWETFRSWGITLFYNIDQIWMVFLLIGSFDL
ncbi:hypothetical protein BDA99DRAFT_536901 [Phascolomyces articulosus]|uniref:Uncharacterized protein n=1 Tax=Phascolomyces articulosus TaxID=60185 RepID=A0AAD5PEK0_9FUNG|nr:hypothetical protein BDA99DRAFT_536901 [Phascolomyces articulosus]